MTVKYTRGKLETALKCRSAKLMPNVEFLIVRFLSESPNRELSRKQLLTKLFRHSGILSFDMDSALAILTFERIVKVTQYSYRLSDDYEAKLRSYVQANSR